jgi:translation initiation factor IF-2
VAKLRIYDLAKKLNLDSKDLISRLNDLGIFVKTASSSVEEDEFNRVKARLEGKVEEAVVEKKAKPTIIRRRLKATEPEGEEAKPEAISPEGASEETAAVSEPGKVPDGAVVPGQAHSPETELPKEPKLSGPTPSVRVEPEPRRARPASGFDHEIRPSMPKVIISEPTPVLPPPVRKPSTPLVKEAKIDEKSIEKLKASVQVTGIPAAVRDDKEKPKILKPKRRRKPGEVEEGAFRRRIFLKGSEEILGEVVGEKPERARGLPLLRKKPTKKGTKKTALTVPKASKRIIRIQETVSVGDLAHRLGIKSSELIKNLMEIGIMAGINQSLDRDTAGLMAEKYQYTIADVSYREEDAWKEEDQLSGLATRFPVVTVMGHVDHGKTLLLDAIRETRVAEQEEGGITQRIGAYRVEVEGGSITFLDTPGHEAFTAMRARGAQVTDIVVLVVAADDGVMPQTIEAINHAKAAGVKIIVAINKIDKATANPDRVKRQLADQGLNWESWGGDTIMVEVSAKERKGIKELLEYILIQAEMLELKANPDRMASGVVIEARLDKGRGPVATVLVKEGTLLVGDPILVGTGFGKVRAMIDDQGRRLSESGPSTPIEVTGLSVVPEAGTAFQAVSEDSLAKRVGELRSEKLKEETRGQEGKRTLENWQEKMIQGESKELRLVLKADMQGTAEALRESLLGLTNDKIHIEIIHTATGNIIESDVMLAAASEAQIIGFSVRTEVKAKVLAEKEKVGIRLYGIIYEVLEDIKAARDGMLEPKFREEILGRAEVREVFPVSRSGNVAGSYVKTGKITRGSRARVVRRGKVVGEGKVTSLRRFKDDAREVLADFECGIKVEGCEDIQTGDIVESFELVRE